MGGVIPQTDKAQDIEAAPDLWATTHIRDGESGIGETQVPSASKVAKRGGNRALKSAILPQGPPDSPRLRARSKAKSGNPQWETQFYREMPLKLS